MKSFARSFSVSLIISMMSIGSVYAQTVSACKAESRDYHEQAFDIMNKLFSQHPLDNEKLARIRVISDFFYRFSYGGGSLEQGSSSSGYSYNIYSQNCTMFSFDNGNDLYSVPLTNAPSVKSVYDHNVQALKHFESGMSGEKLKGKKIRCDFPTNKKDDFSSYVCKET